MVPPCDKSLSKRRGRNKEPVLLAKLLRNQMLVRGVSATPEGTPPVSTPPSDHKRKHASVDDDGDSSALQPTDPSTVVLSRDSSRPRLTVSRHPVFIPSTDGSPFHMTDLSAVNRQLDKVGFKYAPAGLADPGAAVPYRTIESQPMSTRVSWEDRSPLVRVTQDGLGLASDKGFRSARSNVGVQEGRWYMEVRIGKGGGQQSGEASSVGGAHVRLGWGRREAPLNGPVGLDGYSYGVRDKTGEKVTLSRPKRYGRPFGAGDVVGLYISLPPRRQPDPNNPDDPAHIHRERIPIDFRGQEYFESLDYPQSKEMIALMDHPSKTAKADPPHQLKKSATVKNLPSDRARIKPVVRKTIPQRKLPILPGSKIAFFVNGECQGLAFQDIHDYLQLQPASGSKAKEKQRRNKDGPLEHTENHFDDGTLGYYPFFSLFGGAQIHLNPGPDFAFPPPLDVDALLSSSPSSQQRTWRPMSERYPEFMAEQWALDVKEEAEYKAEVERNEVLEGQEEKKRVQKERRRKTEAARRKRKAEEKKAAMAAPATLVDSSPIPGTSVISTLVLSSGSTFIPSLSPSATVNTDMEVALLGSTAFTVTGTPTPSPEKTQLPQPDHELDIFDSSVAQTPPSCDLDGQAQLPEWQSDGPSDDEVTAAARESVFEAETIAQQRDCELTGELVPLSQPVGPQEYSRWIDPSQPG